MGLLSLYVSQHKQFLNFVFFTSMNKYVIDCWYLFEVLILWTSLSREFQECENNNSKFKITLKYSIYLTRRFLILAT